MIYWYCYKWFIGIDSVGVFLEVLVVFGFVFVIKSGLGIFIYGEFFWGNWVYNIWLKLKIYIKW